MLCFMQQYSLHRIQISDVKLCDDAKSFASIRTAIGEINYKCKII